MKYNDEYLIKLLTEQEQEYADILNIDKRAERNYLLLKEVGIDTEGGHFINKVNGIWQPDIKAIKARVKNRKQSKEG